MQDLQSILDPVPVSKDIKAQAWDAFHAAQSPEDFQARLNKLPLSKDVKASLWDAKFSQGNIPDVSVKLDYGDGAETPPRSLAGSALELGKSYVETANPVPVGLLKSIYERGNIETMKGIGAAQADQFMRAKASFKAGNYMDAARYTLGWLIPLVGPAANAAGDELARGEYAKGIGHTLGLGTNIATPAIISELKNFTMPAVLKSKLNPVEAAAVAFGEREGIPLDTATRTGSGAVAGVQNILQKTPGTAGFVKGARQAQSEALASTAERLRQRVEPNLGDTPYTAETAGRTIQETLQSRVSRFGTKAGEAYDQLRQFEEDPQFAQTIVGPDGTPRQINLATDMRGVKQALQPIYNELKQRLPIAQQQANPGLKAIDNILSGEDFVPASVAEGNLGAIKGVARDTRSPQAARLANKAISELDAEVKAAVSAAGPDALRALERGRALTKAKYGAADLLDDLRKEPVQVFNQLTFRKDTAANLLRDVAKQAPQDMPKLGRAFLEGLIEKATAEGGFDKTGTLQNNWLSLGNQTKKLLFQNPMLIEDLDRFFLLAKKIAENPNPSGTASTAASMAAGGMVWANPLLGTSYLLGSRGLAKLLFSPRGSKALTNGLMIPLGNKAAAAAAVSQMLTLAGRDAVRVPTGRDATLAPAQ